MLNLRPPWKKGEAANPTGKQGPHLKSIFSKVLSEIDIDDPEGRTRFETLLDAVATHAKKGHPTAMNAILDRIDPVLRQSITINNMPAPIVDSLRRIGIDSQESASE